MTPYIKPIDPKWKGYMGDTYEYPDKNLLYYRQKQQAKARHSAVVFLVGCVAIAIFYLVTR